MLPIRMIHTADLHIGVENYGRWNPTSGLHARLEDYLASLDQVVAYAIAQAADVFLVAGDIYKTKDPSPTQQREFAKRIRRLTSAGIQVVLLVGNHDQPARHGDANPLDIYASLELEDVTIFRRPEMVTIKTRQGPLQVAGMPHLSRGFLMARQAHVPRTLHESERLLENVIDEILVSLAGDVDPTIPAVLTAHLSIDCASLGSERDLMLGKGLTLPLASLAQPAFDYVAMGHIHKHQVIGEGPCCVYPGSLDRIDFGEESDDKGFMDVTVERGKTTHVRVPITVRPFKTVKVDLMDSISPTDDLVAGIRRTDIEGAAVRLAYTLQAERANMIDERAVSEALTGAFDVVWRPELIPGTTRGRHPELTEALSGSPLVALEKYLALKPELGERAELLLAGARELMAEEL
ncbi:MAG: nuclease SbcCD, subunit [Cyanobacteria bacterium RYN_339]|nr:nuclease SbcCD, subunit [Cyanobacteria bacterium RYN_339]